MIKNNPLFHMIYSICYIVYNYTIQGLLLYIACKAYKQRTYNKHLCIMCVPANGITATGEIKRKIEGRDGALIWDTGKLPVRTAMYSKICEQVAGTRVCYEVAGKISPSVKSAIDSLNLEPTEIRTMYEIADCTQVDQPINLGSTSKSGFSCNYFQWLQPLAIIIVCSPGRYSPCPPPPGEHIDNTEGIPPSTLSMAGFRLHLNVWQDCRISKM